MGLMGPMGWSHKSHESHRACRAVGLAQADHTRRPATLPKRATDARRRRLDKMSSDHENVGDDISRSGFYPFRSGGVDAGSNLSRQKGLTGLSRSRKTTNAR